VARSCCRKPRKGCRDARPTSPTCVARISTWLETGCLSQRQQQPVTASAVRCGAALAQAQQQPQGPTGAPAPTTSTSTSSGMHKRRGRRELPGGPPLLRQAGHFGCHVILQHTEEAKARLLQVSQRLKELLASLAPAHRQPARWSARGIAHGSGKVGAQRQVATGSVRQLPGTGR